jgi:hypothetical protein
MAIKANIVIDQGTDFSATIDVVDANNSVFDLTNYTAAAQMRKNYASASAITFVCSDNNNQGQITLQLTSNTTSTIDPGRYLYDVEITSTGGEVTRVVEGIATVTPGITRV